MCAYPGKKAKQDANFSKSVFYSVLDKNHQKKLGYNNFNHLSLQSV
jgi:hypothetical protein